MSTNRADYPPAVNLGDANAERGWGPKWPHCQYPKMKTVVITDPKGEVVKLAVRGELGPMALDLCYVTERYLEYNLVAGSCWGLSCRPIRGSTTRWRCGYCGQIHIGWPSNHSGGQAFDFNPAENPMQSTFRSDMPASMVKLWAKCGWEWGGWYGSRPDAMHYEYAQHMSTVGVNTRTAREVRAGYDAIDWATPVDWRAMLRAGPDEVTNGARRLQNRLNVDSAMRREVTFLTPDGQYGPVTRRLVEVYQRIRGLTVDGNAGPKTLAALDITFQP